MFTCPYRILILVSIIYITDITTTLSQEGNEYQIKAAVLYNLARMVEWPNDKLVNVNTPITFCFYGEDVFGDTLDSIKDKIANDRSLFLKKNVSIKELGQCQLLFISRSESERLANVLPWKIYLY